MIEKAIEHINAQVKEIIDSDSNKFSKSQARLIGKHLTYVISSDIVAVSILKEGKSLKEFLKKINDFGQLCKKNEKATDANAAEALIKDFGGDDCNVSEYITPEYTQELNELISDKCGSCAGVSSEVIIPLIHAYYNIPLSGITASNNVQAHSNPHGFKRVSLD